MTSLDHPDIKAESKSSKGPALPETVFPYQEPLGGKDLFKGQPPRFLTPAPSQLPVPDKIQVSAAATAVLLFWPLVISFILAIACAAGALAVWLF